MKGRVQDFNDITEYVIYDPNNINSIIRFDLPLASKLKLDRKKEITILKKISSL